MTNPYYNPSGAPGTRAPGSSSTIRAEMAAVGVGFDKLPALAGNALELVRVNAGATAQETVPVGSLGLLLADDLASTTDPAKGAALVFLNVALSYPFGSVGDSLTDVISPRNYPYSAVADGTTNDAAALNSALSSGKKIIDGGGRTYKVNSQVTVPAGITFRNAKLVAATLTNPTVNFIMLAYNNDCTFQNVELVGSALVAQSPSSQQGIAAASPGRSNVKIIDCIVNGCNTNYSLDGTSDSIFRVTSKNAVGQAGVSEGYGLLAYQSANRNIIDLISIGDARHGWYISSGSCQNYIRARTSGIKTGACGQINSLRSQALCTGNVVTGSDYGSYGGPIIAQSSPGGTDAGGAVQNNIIRDFECIGLAAASGIYVANVAPAFLLSIADVGAQPASNNQFLNCSARGAFNSTTLGVFHLSGGSGTVVRDWSIRATCANTVGGAFTTEAIAAGGPTRITGGNMDLLTSGAGIVGAYFNVSQPFQFDDNTLVLPGATKMFFSGNSAQYRLGRGANGASGMTAGTVTVAFASVTAATRIQLTRATTGGTPGHLSYIVTPGTGFQINSSSVTDISTISWQLSEGTP